MNKKIFRFFIIILTISILGVVFLSITKPNKSSSPSIITTNFITYDLARAVTKSSDNLKMLIPPANETHTFEPTPTDILAIENSDLFIYIGGESDEWVENLLKDNNIPKEKTLRLIDFVELKTEDDKNEYDEHIWTNPNNTIRLTQAIRDKLSTISPDSSNTYTKNADVYISELRTIDHEFHEITKILPKKTLVFADRFPFRYFVDEYGLDYLAAFPGCSDQTEVSSATIAKLIEKVKAENIKIILKIELTSDKLAKTISGETGAEIHTFSAGHNISKEDFDSGKTYLDLLHENLSTLREALK